MTINRLEAKLDYTEHSIIECNEICEDEDDDNCDCESCHRAEQMKLRGLRHG